MFLRIITSYILIGLTLAQAHNIAITQIVSHPSLNAVKEGIVDQLKEYESTINIHHSIANGSINTAAQIAANLAGKNIDVAIGISTPSAQALYKKIKDKPVIFTTVTDPKGAGLIVDYQHPEGNVTGVINNMPAAKYIEFIKYLLPKAKSIGIIYNSSEINSALIIKEIKQNTEINLIQKAIMQPSDISQAIKSIAGKIDCLLMIQDNMVATSSNMLINYMLKNHKPVIAAFPEAMKFGALAAIAYDEYKIGRQTGKMVIKILKGEKIAQIPVENAEMVEKIVNTKIAHNLNITLPQNYKSYFTSIK